MKNISYKPSPENITKLIKHKKQITEARRFKLVGEVNNVIPCSFYSPNVKELKEQGFSDNEVMEVMDRVDIQKKNSLHTYSSQLRHVDGKPIAVRREKQSNPIKGLKQR